MRLKAIQISWVFLIISASSAWSEKINFDTFLKRAARCEQSAEFRSFGADLFKKYRNDAGSKGEQVDQTVEIRIPSDISKGIGIPRSVNKGEYTQVDVPLDGTWKELALQGFEFAFGNENGVNQWTVLFAEPRSKVVRVFGPEVSVGNHILQKEDSGAGFGWSATIPSGTNGKILCDHST